MTKIGKTKIEFYKLMNNAIYEKATETFRNRIDVKPINNEKGYLKCKSVSCCQ